MNAIVVYESLWGNTAEVARAVAEGLGPGARALRTDEATAADAAGADLIVAGAPVFGFKLSSQKMRDGIRQSPGKGPAPDLSCPLLRTWLERSPAGTACAAGFDTQVRGPFGKGAPEIEKLFEAEGYARSTSRRGSSSRARRVPLKKGEAERARAWGDGSRARSSSGAPADGLAALRAAPRRPSAALFISSGGRLSPLSGLVPCVTRAFTLGYAASVAGGFTGTGLTREEPFDSTSPGRRTAACRRRLLAGERLPSVPSPTATILGAIEEVPPSRPSVSLTSQRGAMGKKIFILLVVALIGMLLLPALASATLVNEYGMHFAGQTKCVDCHSKMSGDLKVAPALHGKFATAGIVPGTPAAGLSSGPPATSRSVPGTGQSQCTAGGSYGFSLPWITLGDSTGNSATEYLFFQGSSDPTVMPWNLVEGLVWEPSGEWVVGETPRKGL